MAQSNAKNDWLTLPAEYTALLERQIHNLHPWHVMTLDEAKQWNVGLKERLPDRTLFAFARRHDNDDIACWELGKGEQVIVLHDFESPGWEEGETFPNIRDWLHHAVDEMLDFGEL